MGNLANWKLELMIFQRLCPSRIFTGIFLFLVCNGFASLANAELRYSYSSDLSNSAQVAGSQIEARSVYFFNSNQNAPVTCCELVRGPSAARSDRVFRANLHSGEALQIDLSGYPVGGVYSAKIGNDSAAHEFTIVRSADTPVLQLQESGPVVSTHDGQVIENLRIDANTDHSCAISVKGHKNVVIRNVYITHKNLGICAEEAESVLIQKARVVSTSAPKRGPHCRHGVEDCRRSKDLRATADKRLNIKIHKSDNAVVDFVETEKGASGILVRYSNNVHLTSIRCFDVRGPRPRGGCLQFEGSHFGSMKNFYSKNILDVSADLDTINAWKSDYVTISNGLVDGSFGINGAGAVADNGSDNFTISDVDFVRTSGMAAAVSSSGPNDTIGSHFVAENIRVRDTVCVAHGGGPPSSGGLVVWVKGGADYPRVSNYTYFNHCRKYTVHCLNRSCRDRNGGKGGQFDIREQDFTPREPLQLLFDWEHELTDFPSTQDVLEGL